MWGWLKPVLKIGAAAAAPFTGGASLAAMPVIDAIGGAASSGAQGMAANRGANADLEVQRQQTNINNESVRNKSAGDAWQQLLRMAYIGAPASQRVQSPGISRYSRPIAGPTAMQQTLANSQMIRKPLLDRASFNYNPVDWARLEKQQKQSGWEKVLGIIGAASPIVSAGIGAANRPPVDYSAFDNPNNWG